MTAAATPVTLRNVAILVFADSAALAQAARAAAADPRLAKAQVDVREGGSNEKLALCGDAVWVGSANAMFAARSEGAQTEWGLVSRAPALVAAARAALERDARAGISGPVPPSGAGASSRRGAACAGPG